MSLIVLNTSFNNSTLPKVAVPSSLNVISGAQAVYEMRDKLDQSGNTRDLVTGLAFDSAGLVCTGVAAATAPLVEPSITTFLVVYNATGNDKTRNILSSLTGTTAGSNFAGSRLLTTAAGALTLQSALNGTTFQSATLSGAASFGNWKMALGTVENTAISLQLYGGSTANAVMATRSAATGQYLLGGGVGSFPDGMVGKIGLFSVWNRLLTTDEKNSAFSKAVAIMAAKGVAV